MTKLPHISTRLKNSYLVWFIESKKFALLKKTVFELLQMLTSRTDNSKIISYCENEFSLDKTAAELFSNTFLNSIINLKQLNNTVNIPSPKFQKLPSHLSLKYYKTTYLFGNKPITFEYGNYTIKQIFHPLFEHYELKSKENTNYKITLLEIDSILYIYYNQQLLHSFNKNDIPFFKGTVYKKIYSIINNFQDNEWMMTTHSSGVIYENNAFLFTGASGSGKSTMAALLNANGYQCISDDFIAIDKKGEAYPFPAAISLKEGSFSSMENLIPKFSKLKSFKLENNTSVKKYPFYNNKLENSYPVKAIIIIRFSNKNINRLQLVATEDAICFILKESWINPTIKNMKYFMHFIEKIPIYTFHYNSNKTALRILSDFFKK